MPNTYYGSELTGEQIEAALTAIGGVVTQENNGKVLAIEAGKIVAKSASEWTDTPVLEPLSVTANGDYTPGAGVDGFNSVHVDVSGGGGSKIVTVVTSVTGGYNGGAVITIVVDGVTIFTATAPDTYNQNYDKTSDTVDFSGDIIAIEITPPPTSTSKLGIDISSSTDRLNFQVSPDGENTSYGYSFSDTSTLRIAQEVKIEPLLVTQNGTYNPPSGVDGYAPVTVDVSSSELKCFEVYDADGYGGARREKGLLDNNYFVCFFHDNMSSVFTLNGENKPFTVNQPGYDIGRIMATTIAVANPAHEHNNAVLTSEGSEFSVSHSDSGSYISVVGGWVGYPAGGTIYEQEANDTVNSVALNAPHNTLLIFVGASNQGLSTYKITINGVEYDMTRAGVDYDSVYSMYGAIVIENNSDTTISVTFPISCYNYVSVIGIDS